jgi:ribosomal-protein-alanine N-acetyltransferase
MELRGKGVNLRPLVVEDAAAVLDVWLRNKEFLAPFEPDRPPEFGTLGGQSAAILRDIDDAREDRSYVFGIFLNSTDELIGRISLSKIVRHSFQNGVCGYFCDRPHNGRGHTTEAVRLIVRFAFEELGLHRIEAGVMPHNIASIRVLEKAGFRREGLMIRYLKIDGAWRDHISFAITTEDLYPVGSGAGETRRSFPSG